ncbi:hypothetical protein HMPREF0860_0189 [Treponema socranskii subsp. socranskii VPI DR56BR1116 = ATCC 35536]|uniref:Uncharacterized protein n=1 Tax=Treponema socranskii subsp. socranskii VPI DR56BR1116 = ATCC 35536 TaxID=1125725 RepID=U1GVS7_TRESO|nr:hypothetical protein HMPREF1325_0711 [Treponema socranskii subsp. socranskii VPI DR56BR1116 = ATCC 35536]ERK02690.1 hypothetical protein HMPREF0860_0189 [Treponema socranskii subsp. socranskii VPI DR56BR1116 = ATCC 35536]
MYKRDAALINFQRKSPTPAQPRSEASSGVGVLNPPHE